MHPRNIYCDNCNTQKKNYTISGRTIKKVVDDTGKLFNEDLMIDFKFLIKKIRSMMNLFKIIRN